MRVHAPRAEIERLGDFLEGLASIPKVLEKGEIGFVELHGRAKCRQYFNRKCRFCRYFFVSFMNFAIIGVSLKN